MQFAVIAHDGPDALSRRLELRDEHVAQAVKMKTAGNLLFGLALLDDEGVVCGSVMVVEFGSRDGVDAWLEREAYVTGGVWENIEVSGCRVGPMFLPGRPTGPARH